MAASRSRRFRGGGKYSSSEVIRTSVDAVALGARSFEHRLDELLGSRGAGGHPDGAAAGRRGARRGR